MVFFIPNFPISFQPDLLEAIYRPSTTWRTLPTIFAPRQSLFIAHIEHLASASVPEDGDAFTSKIIGQVVDFQYIASCSAIGKINSLGHGIISIFLESRLDLNMLFRRNVQRRDKEILQILRYSCYVVYRTLASYLGLQLRRV